MEYNIVQSVTIKKEVPGDEIEHVSLLTSNSGNPERFTTIHIKKEFLSTDVDESFASGVERRDMKIESIGDYTTTHIGKEEIGNGGLETTSGSVMEKNEFESFHPYIDTKKEIIKSELMDVSDPVSSDSSVPAHFEEKVENNLEPNEISFNSDSQKSSRNMSENLPHSRAEPFRCYHCNKGFVRKGDLRSHLHTHSGEKPFKCNYCGKKFARNRNLKTHLLAHTGEEPFKCDYCDKGFTRKDTLQSHLQIHTGEKPFKCDYCDKQFARHCNLKTHLLAHTGEKPFQCDYCDKGFTRKETLQSHLLTHAGEKPFKCEYCSKGFAWKRNLKSHLLTHTGDKCDYSNI